MLVVSGLVGGSLGAVPEVCDPQGARFEPLMVVESCGQESGANSPPPTHGPASAAETIANTPEHSPRATSGTRSAPPRA